LVEEEKGAGDMNVDLPPEDLECTDRIMRDEFGGDEVRLFIYGKPFAADDGLFPHSRRMFPHSRLRFVPCAWCVSDATTGEAPEPHIHMVMEGSTGGVRCAPLRLGPILERLL
jgi:hypothetical protein